MSRYTICSMIRNILSLSYFERSTTMWHIVWMFHFLRIFESISQSISEICSFWKFKACHHYYLIFTAACNRICKAIRKIVSIRVGIQFVTLSYPTPQYSTSSGRVGYCY